MSGFHLRKMTAADLPAVHNLVRELAIYEKAPENHTATVADYERDLAAGWFAGQVAVDDASQEVLGMIFFYESYSTWRGRMLYLEDFVVRESERGRGIGAVLFEAFLEEARQRQCVLAKWQVLDWNEPAINFYKKYDALLDGEWLNGRIFL